MLREGPAKRELPHSRSGKHFPTTLILSPTRELALQIHEECQRVGESMVFHCSFVTALESPQQWCMEARTCVIH